MSIHSNLYVCGLPEFGLDDASFRSMFEAYGQIISCKCVPEKRYGFVKYASHEQAELAVSGLSGFELGGSTIQVRFADNDRGKGGGKFGEKGGDFGGGGFGGGGGGWEQPKGGGWMGDTAQPWDGGFGKGKGDGGKSGPVEPSDNLYIKGLPLGTTEATVQSVFGAYGAVSSCKVLAQPEGATTAAAMVRMGTVEQASWMVDNLNGNIPQGLTDAILVKYAQSGGGKGKGDGGGAFPGGPAPPSWGAAAPAAPMPADQPSDNLYIKGLPVGMTEDFVREIFGAYGGIASVKVLSTPEGADNSAALVRFREAAQATWLVDNLNGNIPKGLSTPVIVRYANAGPGKGGQEKGADARFTPYGKGGMGAPMMAAPMPINFGSGEEGSNLYVRGLPQTADDLYLYKVFAPVGAILSVKAISSAEKGGGPGCAGYGFVKYTSSEEANKAIMLLNSTPLPDGTMLQVSVKTAGGKGKAAPSVVPAKNGAPPPPMPGGSWGDLGGSWDGSEETDMNGLVAAIAASGDEEAAAALAALS